MLSPEKYHKAIELTQIVSIDIIIRSSDGILLGKRTNNPAKGYWFVPGGRVFKGESLSDGFTRIALDEIGLDINLKTKAQKDRFKFLGVYEHRYNNNFQDEEFGTHYICMACEYTLAKDGSEFYSMSKMREQHSYTRWFTENEILEDAQVHKYVKMYFKPTEEQGNRFGS